jgi:tRNA A-37 threonylcarbamoyl transferase component Bud32
VDAPFPELSALPHLATTFIEGPTLREQLSGSRLSPEDKKALLTDLFDEVSRRHDRAVTENNRWLYHIDANTRNIIHTDGGRICHVDFEMGRPWEPAIACAAREITKLLTTAAEDMPPPEQKTLCNAFQSAYHHEDVRRFMGKSVYGRPFQGVHRWMDHRKKEKNPRAVTLYDILDRLPPGVISR